MYAEYFKLLIPDDESLNYFTILFDLPYDWLKSALEKEKKRLICWMMHSLNIFLRIFHTRVFLFKKKKWKWAKILNLDLNMMVLHLYI